MPGRTTPGYDLGPWAIVVVAIGIIVSEPMVFHIESRNEAISFSPSDIPLAIGVVVLSPVALLVARLVGAAVGLLLFREQRLFKFTLNLASFATEAMVAITVYRLLTGVEGSFSIGSWLALIVSMLVALVTASLVIDTAISCFEGDWSSRIVKELSHTYLFHLPGAVVGSSAAAPMAIDPQLGIVFLVPAPLVWLVLRSHGQLMHRYTDLSQVHTIATEISQHHHLEAVTEVAVREIAVHFRAQVVGLIVWDDVGGSVRASHGDARLAAALPASPAELPPALQSLDTEPAAMAASEGGTRGAWLASLGVDEAIVVPLTDDERDIGLLVVADRHGASHSFSDDDRSRLRPITQQLAVALAKSQLHQEIHYEATHDRLTGLHNRSFFEAWMNQTLRSDAVGEGSCALLLLDLDRFKEVNDTHGHRAGDELLTAVARRLAACLRANDLASRLGGDEFAVFMTDVDAGGPEALAERVSEAIEQPFQLTDATVAVASSIGIAVSPDHGSDTERLVRRADLAMYDAKRNHRRYTRFRPDLEGADSERLALLADLRTCLARRELLVYFQPQIELAHGSVVGVEALARWRHPARGFVPPEQFIAVVEQAGLIGSLTEQVLERSLEAVRHWLDEGRPLSVAVNISALSLTQEGLVEAVAAALRRADVPPRLLTLEVTESTMLGDTPRIRQTLVDLAALGVSISIDDFGTGYSSLASLRHLPFTELKIDRAFVSRMLDEANSEVIVRSTIALGHALGMTIVGEGVETDGAREALALAGCDRGQGYGICRPLPLDEVDHWLRFEAPAVESSRLA